MRQPSLARMIRPVTLADLWSLRRKPRSTVMLYNEEMLANPHRPFWFALRCAIGGGSRVRSSLLYSERGSQAMVQALGRRRRAELDITMLASYITQPGVTDPDAWFRLLEQLCVQAGQYQMQRVYAALSQRHDELREVFRQLGFTCFAHQTVMRLEGPDWDQGTQVADMRSQSHRDVWAIHKLYGTITPRPVQIAEARGARDWKLPLSDRWQPVRRRAWVLGEADNLGAYLTMTSGPAAHVLTMLLLPEMRDQATEVLRFGLGQVGDDVPVYLLLRDYQHELLLPAGDLGFQPIGEQALLQKQMTVQVRRPLLAPAREVRPDPSRPLPTTISLLDEDARHYDRPA